ncbi:uncharacterized protein LOC132804048 [Ziziphus jujuba]|uniref:Uncharacterized protein LOC132804048 n=1 Tax=Ziziphus jujuba TaxID=326968 RepID=A0ABM4AB09_ZIZJJ|nr:uncharacterized protein LOC132804048 [Ziziphus jujuba]
MDFVENNDTGDDIDRWEFSIQSVINRFNETKNSIALDLASHPSRPTNVNGQGWRRPQAGFIKINTDAALSKRGSCLAMVVRNDVGNILLIRTFKSEIEILEVAEMEAILKAVQVATSQSWNNICIESDASAVIDTLSSKNRKSLHWKAEHLANHIFQLIPMFDNLSFVWTAREYNNLAHLVGQWAKNSSFFGEVYLYSLPSFLLRRLIQESVRGVAT